jgi:hypothetical protein
MILPTIEGLTAIATTLRKADKLEEYESIIAAREKLLEYGHLIENLEADNKRLKDLSSFRERVVFNNNSYWDGSDGPFCSKCLDSNEKKVRLHLRPQDGHGVCPDCKNTCWTRGEPHYEHEAPRMQNWYM